MKKYILFIFISLLSFAKSFAQQIVTSKGDKIPVENLQVEPWNVAGGTTKASANTQNIYTKGSVGIGEGFAGSTANLIPRVNIKPSSSGTPQEALQITGMLDIKNNSNIITDVSGQNFYNLKISEQGYVRRAKPTDDDLQKRNLYELKPQYKTVSMNNPQNQTTFTASMQKLSWERRSSSGAAETLTDIILPEDGAYVFSFNMYGTLSGTPDNSTVQAFYIYAFKNDKTFDLVEINLIHYSQMTYSVCLTVSGRKGDKVTFAINNWNTTGMPNWTLTSNPGDTNGNKTSMAFWKLSN